MTELNRESLTKAVAALKAGQLVGMPTETVYGLAANAWDADACERIFKAKGRPSTNPLIVHIASLERIGEAVSLPLASPIAERLAAVSDLWPGPLTLVLPRAPHIPDLVTAGLPTVAVRIPDHAVALELLAACPFPLAAPSANRSTAVSPTSADDVREELADSVAVVLEGGRCRCGLESTILSLVGHSPRILRLGACPAERLAERLHVPLETLLGNEKDRITAPTEAALAPGTHRLHYAPKTPVWLIEEAPAPSARQGRWGYLKFSARPSDHASSFAEIRVLSQTGDAEQIAAQLFASLRELDRLDLQGIIVDRCDEVGIGRAVMDRLRRAAANRETH